MRYLLLIVNDEQQAAVRPLDKAGVQAWEEFLAEMRAAGKLLGAERLRPSGTATTVRRADGRALLSDGPFVESKEHLGGFAVLDVPDDAAARYWAGRIAVAVGWPQEVHRFPHRIRPED